MGLPALLAEDPQITFCGIQCSGLLGRQVEVLEKSLNGLE